jgi:hypothetical protein
MDTDASRPGTTKELLIHHSLRRLESRYRHEFASGLLSGRVDLPARWLEHDQMVFVELEADSTLDADVHTAALELADRVLRLCDLIYDLIDDFSRRHRAAYALDQKERATLRRGGGPAAVCGVIFRDCDDWPATDPRRLRKRVRKAVDKALSDLVRQQRAQPRPGTVPVIRRPVDDRDLAVWHKTRATDDKETLKRYLLYESFEVVRGLVGAAALSILYLGLFLALKYFTPDLTAHEDMIVAGTAIATALGGTGVVLVGRWVKAYAGRGRSRDPGRSDPPAGARRSGDAE